MISVKVIADSTNATVGARLTTFELTYPRFILAELNTHRVFSRNSSSSRAIPIDIMIQSVETCPATPIEWGLNKAGMQAEDVHTREDFCYWTWKQCAKKAVESATALKELGLHKQVVNRVLEPFQIMKTVITATEFDNFFWLRCHKDAQPEIRALADLMYSAYQDSEPQELQVGEWHLPYVKDKSLTLEEAQKVSASCCAQVSYRKNDDSLEKALRIYDQLVSMAPSHASPFEHQGTPIDYEGMGYDAKEGNTWSSEGVTHLDTKGDLWSGNLRGWIQYRQLIKDNVCNNYLGEN